MKARKGRLKQPTRLQVAWTLVKAEPRVAILFWFLVASAAAILGFEIPALFNLIPRGAAPLAAKLLGLLQYAAVAGALVLASILWGARHFSIFSLLDRMLTHRLIAAAGLALIVMAIHSTLTKPYSPHRPSVDLANGAIMWAGSFLFFWVFLFYGRKRSATSN